MGATPSFAEQVGEIASGLRENAPHPVGLNRAAGGIDQLGRRLHGLGLARHDEIARCLTAAIHELAESHALAEEERAAAAGRAAGHLEAARDHAGSDPAPGVS